jgi:cytochrome P450
MQLMAWPWPSITARVSFQARESLVPDMMEYFVKGYHEEGSPLVKCRFAYNTQHGLGLEDMARGEIGQTSAAITNTIPASFWFVWHIFSDPAVLRDCCREVEQLVTRDASTGICTLDLGQVKSSCPVLLSTWQETLRYRHIGLQARVVMEDHLFDGRYLLKKGATVMVVTPALHSEASVWGPDSTKFDHRRFLRDREGHTDAMKRPSPAAFRGFGGGSTLCPGRHFVTNEVLCFAALLISRFDIRPVKGVWREPGVGLQLTDALPKPIEPIEVEIVPKAEQEWKVLLPTTIKVEMGEAEM